MPIPISLLWSIGTSWTKALLEELDPDPGLIGMVGGFLNCIPFHGEELCNEWKAILYDIMDEILTLIQKQFTHVQKGQYCHEM